MSTSLHPSPSRFVAWFRSVAPYIHSFRGKTFVIAFGGEVVADGPATDVVIGSPMFAPQVSKVLAPQQWLTVSEVAAALVAAS